MCKIDCANCPLNSSNNGTNGMTSCSDFETFYPEKAIAIVQKWSDEHPQRTYLTEFLKHYPNAQLKTVKDMQVDHIQSVYWYNGANDIENYNSACRMCNFYKSTRTVEDLKKELGKLLSRLEKVFIFRLAVKYGLIQKTDNPIEFYFEKQNKTGKESEK